MRRASSGSAYVDNGAELLQDLAKLLGGRVLEGDDWLGTLDRDHTSSKTRRKL